MNNDVLSDEFCQWLVATAQSGAGPEQLIAPLLQAGWSQQRASAAVDAALRRYVDEHARRNGLPLPVAVPSPFALNGPSQVQVDGRAINVLGSSLHPRVVLLGNVLSAEECAELIDTARGRLKRSATFNAVTGENEAHQSRTSDGTYLPTACTSLVARIEQRIADLAGWPLDHAEPLQVLHYGPGAEYKPHYDYFDPDGPGADAALRHGGQRVATLVTYLNTPLRGGATTFPDAGLEFAAVQGNAVFFSYDRAHPSTKTLHAGAPVIEGEKWVLTRWFRERRFG
ncbi:proline dioxygenase [Stenotrophomonas ginsengisoli]|uniref:Proline dioxygenase n=1 Tax=Stenotrophomonas ginsengisoli TaxID=336566 RepID=A0A0R0D5B1_9GAMM|nr:2OG-Fe(II) oxygenase [Stenotrophomonas ginsengisoli]KRG77417.1 proline dioxygenase [Stenotrophomonas ginsengisoli]